MVALCFSQSSLGMLDVGVAIVFKTQGCIIEIGKDGQSCQDRGGTNVTEGREV